MNDRYMFVIMINDQPVYCWIVPNENPNTIIRFENDDLPELE